MWILTVGFRIEQIPPISNAPVPGTAIAGVLPRRVATGRTSESLNQYVGKTVPVVSTLTIGSLAVNNDDTTGKHRHLWRRLLPLSETADRLKNFKGSEFFNGSLSRTYHRQRNSGCRVRVGGGVFVRVQFSSGSDCRRADLDRGNVA